MKMKKRLIFTFTIVVLIFSSMVLSAPTTEDSDLIKEKKPLSGKEILLTEGTSPEGEFKQYSPISEVTTKSGAILKSNLPLGGLLKTFLNGLIIAESFTDLLIPDSIHLTEINNLQYNTIENYIILDSASSLEALVPINYKLNNIGKTKIQLDENNEVQFVETEIKDEKPQEFTSPFNDKDSISITTKKNTRLKVDTSKENKLGIQSEDSTVEFKPKDNLQKKKLIFTIKNGEIIVSEDNGYYKVEGSNVLTSFESISFKQFLDKTKEVEFNSEEGFSEIKFNKQGSFIQEYPTGFTIKNLELEELTFARSFKITSVEEFNLYISTELNKEDLFNKDIIQNKALIDLKNHKIILKGIIDYERISADISKTQLELGKDEPSSIKFDNGISIRIDGKKKAREIKQVDFKYKKIIESKKENNIVTLNIDNNNLFVNADINLNPSAKSKGELFKAHTDSLLIYDLPTEISTKTLRFANFEYINTPDILKQLKTNINANEITKIKDIKVNELTAQSSFESIQKFYSSNDNSKNLFKETLNLYEKNFPQCSSISMKNSEINRYLKSLLPILSLLFFIPFSLRKKANFSLLAIAAFVVILILGVSFYVFNNINEKSSIALSSQEISIKDSINECYKKTLECGIYGFSLNAESFTSKDFSYPADILEKFIKNNINSCINSLNYSNIKIFNPQNVKVIFSNDNTIVSSNHLIELSSLKETRRLNRFDAEIKIRIDEVFKALKQIKNSKIKDIPLSLLSDANLNAEIYDLGQGLVYILTDKSGLTEPTFKFMIVKSNIF